MLLLREYQWIAVVDQRVGMLFLTYAMVLVLTTLFNAPRIAFVMMCDSVCVYFILAMIWAMASFCYSFVTMRTRR